MQPESCGHAEFGEYDPALPIVHAGLVSTPPGFLRLAPFRKCSDTSETKSNTCPSLMLRSSFMYSAWAHMSGMAAVWTCPETYALINGVPFSPWWRG